MTGKIPLLYKDARVFEKLSRKFQSPVAVQKFIKTLDYNKDHTQRSALSSLQKGKAHCLEGALIAAAILEKHGFPPLIVSIESQDGLDHVLFVFKSRGRWGSIGKSRDEGLHGRKPVFRSIKDLVWSYYDPYIDGAGKITAYQIVNLNDINANWRDSKKNLWKVENYLLEVPHEKLRSSSVRYKKVLRAYKKRGPMKRRPHWL